MKILVAGDFCPQNRVAKLFQNKQFAEVLKEMKPVIEQADYAIVNLECPICQGEEQPILKCGPRLKCDVSGIEAIKWVGFDCITLANNHFLDFGYEGVINTLEECQRKEIDTVGGGLNLQEASQTLYKTIEGKTLAIINCCEHEFSIASETSAGSNPLNPIHQYYAIKESRQKADFVMVIVHGGHEHFQLPSPRMQETYRFFIEAGADAVVNHHQHCYSGYEIYKGKPIFYGLGNFCFDKGLNKNQTWYEGYMVSISFCDNISFELHPYVQCKEKAEVKLSHLNVIRDVLYRLNEIIADRQQLEQCEKKYYRGELHKSNIILEPFSNRYVRALQYRRLLPEYPFGRKYLLRLYNYLLCEAHRDKISFFLNHNIQNAKHK